MDTIISIIQCKWCLSCFVDPVSLPCGNSMCEKHTDELRAAEWVCVLCGEVHKLADGERFPINKPLRSMLEINIAKLDFGPIYKEAKQQIEALESKSVQMKHVIQHPGDYVSTITTKHRTQVDLGREEAMEVLDKVFKAVNLQITDYESAAVENIEKQATKMTELTKSADVKIASWKQSLNALAVNEDLWKEITSGAKKLGNDFDSQMKSATLDPPYNITDLSWRIGLDASIEMSKRFDKYNTRNNSVLVRDVSKIAQAQSWNSIDSECFTVEGFQFYLRVKFKIEDGKMALGAYLFSASDHEDQNVSVSWKTKVFGKHYQIIAERDANYEFKYKTEHGFSRLIFLNDILSNPAFDPLLDLVRVQVEIDETSFSLVSRPPPIRQSMLVRDVSKIARAQSWKDLDSEIFAVRDFKFSMRVKFVHYCGKMHLRTSLSIKTEDITQKVKLSYMFQILGLNDEKIKSFSTESEIDNHGWGWRWPKIISLKEIIAHQAYNAQEDSVRVEVVVYEDTLEEIDVKAHYMPLFFKND